MPELTTRAGKGSELTHNEQDANFKRTVSQKTTDYTCLISDNRNIIEGNHATTAFTITLPPVATAAASDTGDYEITVTNINAAIVSVDGNGAETINGSTETIDLAQWEAVTIGLDSAQTAWAIISEARRAPVVMTAQATTSGTAIDFTGIPSWATEIVVGFNQVQHNGTSEMMVQIGDSGGIENGSYVSSSSLITSGGTNTSSNTAGFGIRTQAANEEFSGSMILTLIDSSNNTWAANGNFVRDSTTEGVVTGGRKSLSGTLTQVRITSFAGDTFNGGTAGVRYS